MRHVVEKSPPKRQNKSAAEAIAPEGDDSQRDTCRGSRRSLSRHQRRSNLLPKSDREPIVSTSLALSAGKTCAKTEEIKVRWIIENGS